MPAIKEDQLISEKYLAEIALSPKFGGDTNTSMIEKMVRDKLFDLRYKIAELIFYWYKDKHNKQIDQNEMMRLVKKVCNEFPIQNEITPANIVAFLDSINEQFVTEQTEGYWKVSSMVPQPNGLKRLDGIVKRPQNSSKRGILGVFYSRYVPRNKISEFVNMHEKSATLRWMAPGSSSATQDTELTINDKNPTKNNWLNFPISNG